jgi:cysteine desulfurase/selenocysteine lyase
MWTWVNTMSTSEAATIAPATPDTGSLTPSLLSAEAPTGIPSPAQIARMANELFNALPDELQQPAVAAARAVLPPNSAFTGNPYAAVPNPTAPAVPGLAATLTDSSPGAFVSTPDRSIAPALGPSAPAVPAYAQPAGAAGHSPAIGSGVGSGPSSESGFGFLSGARPLYTEPTGVPPQAEDKPQFPANSAAPAGASDESAYAALPASLGTDLQPPQSLQPPAPALPGALGFADSSAVPTFSFLEEARPLFSTPPSIPGPSPSLAAPSSANSAAKPTASENPFAAPLPQNLPQLPGVVAHPPDQSAPAAQPPNSQLRSLDSLGFAPVLIPSSGQQALPGDLGLSSTSFDVEAIRRDFPILQEVVNGHKLIWLDNAATTQKPQSVIDRVSYFYQHENSNVHRAAHELAARSTDAYESAREKTRRFLNAGATREIIFVRGATEAINLVAQSWGRRNIQKDDEIVITWLEHHANIVPWQMLCAEKGARLRVAPVDSTGQVLLDEYEKLLGPKTRLVSLAHVSNALGTIVPVTPMVEAAHRHGARVLVDGAQAVSHMRVDVQAIDCDFYVFSGHKVFAPTGIGVVYGKSEVLDSMPPWQGGGNMIQDVTFEKTIYQGPPQRFEAGTGSIADAVGLGAAIDYLDRVGIANVSRHEHVLLTYATAALNQIPGLTIIGTAKEKASVLSFIMDGFRTEEIGDYLNRKGIAVRGGHHCAQPILRRFGLESTVRATFALYNTCEEVDALIAALWDLRQGRNPGLA